MFAFFHQTSHFFFVSKIFLSEETLEKERMRLRGNKENLKDKLQIPMKSNENGTRKEKKKKKKKKSQFF